MNQISQINENIYISGALALTDDNIKKNNIKYILSCIGDDYVRNTHQQLIINNQHLTILYLPYEDMVNENLWRSSEHNKASIVKYASSTEEHNNIYNMILNYQHRPMIEIAYHFINTAVKNNENILVHCMAGISRSVSMVIYYLMKKNKIDYDTAFNFVKNKRTIANPNDSFRKQLKLFHVKRDKYNSNDSTNIINNFYY